MAYLTLAQISGDADRLFAAYSRTSATMDEVGRDHGLLVHAVARTGEGLLIVNLWPSPDGSRTAAQDSRRNRVIRDHGLQPEQMRRRHHDVARYVIFEDPSP
jgi:hypothetical protein